MSHDRRAPRRLPADPRYWEDLAGRAIEAAFGEGAGSAGERAATEPGRPHGADAALVGAAPSAGVAPVWWARLADAAPALAAAAVLTLVTGAVLLGDRAAPVAPDAIVDALSPDEPMLRTLLLTGTEPPPASALVDLVALREDER